jgi:hypothetical protein
MKSQHEIVVATDKSHDDICNVQVGGSLYKAIDYVLQRSLEYAPGLIFKKFHSKFQHAICIQHMIAYLSCS